MRKIKKRGLARIRKLRQAQSTDFPRTTRASIRAGRSRLCRWPTPEAWKANLADVFGRMPALDTSAERLNAMSGMEVWTAPGLAARATCRTSATRPSEAAAALSHRSVGQRKGRKGQEEGVEPRMVRTLGPGTGRRAQRREGQRHGRGRPNGPRHDGRWADAQAHAPGQWHPRGAGRAADDLGHGPGRRVSRRAGGGERGGAPGTEEATRER